MTTQFSETSQEPVAEDFPALAPVLSKDQQELSDALKSLRLDPLGVTTLGKDGIYRSLDIDRNVVDAVPLNPRLLKPFLDRLPLPFDQKQEDYYRGVDGSKTPHEQWFNPDKSLLPPPPPPEESVRARIMREYKENKEAVDERLRQRQNGESGSRSCPIVVTNDYNLGPKIDTETQ